MTTVCHMSGKLKEQTNFSTIGNTFLFTNNKKKKLSSLSSPLPHLSTPLLGVEPINTNVISLILTRLHFFNTIDLLL